MIFKGCVLIVGGVMLAIPSDLLKRVSEANTFGFATYDHLADVGLVVGLLGAVLGGLYALVGALTAMRQTDRSATPPRPPSVRA